MKLEDNKHTIAQNIWFICVLQSWVFLYGKYIYNAMLIDMAFITVYNTIIL